MSHTPLVAARLHRALGIAPIPVSEPDLAVACGSVTPVRTAIAPPSAARPRIRPTLLRTFSPGGIVRGASPVNAVALSPGGRLLAAGSDDRRVRVWDLGTGQVRHTLSDHDGPVRAVAFSPDGSLLASGGGHPRRAARAVRIWQADEGRRRDAFDADPGGPAALAFHPSGRVLAAAGVDGVLRLFDLADGRLSRAGEGPALHAVAYRADGSALATGDDAGVVLLHSAAPPTPLHGHRGAVLGVAFGGPMLASAGADATVRLWDGPSSAVLTGHTEPVTAVAFDPAATLLASAGLDSTIRLWDATSGTHLHTLDGHDGAVHALAFTPDGSILVSAGADGAVRLWNLSTRP
nr:hypothetical protein GCM10020063_016000 [Dactylosporangium thailandense]